MTNAAKVMIFIDQFYAAAIAAAHQAKITGIMPS
jgi:hypothetical protein